jgi:hypothetical protein
MASTYTPLGVELMATGENAGTWGTKTNVNLQLGEQISSGYVVQTLNAAGAGANTTTLSVSDGSTGATLASRVIILGAVSAQAITGNKIVTIPIDVETWYFIKNSTSGAYTVQFKYVSGSGGTVTWATTDKGWKAIYAAANDGTNPDIIDIGMGDVTLAGTQTLTNKTLTSPKIGTSILDTNGLQLALLTATGSAVNEITLANAASGSNPTLTASGDDSNIGISLATKGSGVIKAEDSGGTVSAVKIAGTETMWIPANALYLPTTNPADAASVETTATRPELKVLDFDAGTAQYAQFAIAMPKSWNLGTVTYQVFWSPSSTNTGNCIFGLQGLACTEGDTADAVFGTAIEVTDAGIGTVEDVQMTAVSSAMTLAGSPADDDQCFFQLYRDAADGSDTFTGEARVLGIKLFYTTDAANDA